MLTLITILLLDGAFFLQKLLNIQQVYKAQDFFSKNTAFFEHSFISYASSFLHIDSSK